ncbi:MAG: DUF5995 family protein [Egibacteraceae bacterium]
MPFARPIDELLARFEAAYAPLLARDDERRHFHGLYLRNTRAVKAEIGRGGFLDAEWVERWAVAFANRYLDALEQWERTVTSPGPWQLAFEAARDPAIPPLRHQLVGLNAHLNFDLPQALLAVMRDEDWADPGLVARRHTDFAHIDGVVIRRVPEEYRRLLAVEAPGDRALLDRLLYPLNLAASARWLREARRKVWRNAALLEDARRQGPSALDARLRQLERRSRAKVAELLTPGQVLLTLAVRGFGVALPPER